MSTALALVVSLFARRPLAQAAPEPTTQDEAAPGAGALATGTMQPASPTPSQPPAAAPAPASTAGPGPAAQAPSREAPPGPYAEPMPMDQSRDGYQQNYYEPPPPPPKRKSDVPAFAVRVDPFNAVINGRMGLELEVQLWEFVTAEVVPIFVVWDRPPAFNFVGREDTLYQESNGLGSISGASVGAGFWLEGKPLRGYVLRAVFTNYSYRYLSQDDLGVIDRASHVERILYGFIGSYNKIGYFTIGGGIGLGLELNRHRRCFAPGVLENGRPLQSTSDCSDDELLIALDRPVPGQPTPYTDLYGFLHPAYIEARISLGFVFAP